MPLWSMDDWRYLERQVIASGYTDAVGEWLVHERADALVLDCSAYDMSESLFDMVRSDPAHAALPVVIISDTPEVADASLRAREAGHVLLIPKPFTGAQVARALDQLLTITPSPDHPVAQS